MHTTYVQERKQWKTSARLKSLCARTWDEIVCKYLRRDGLTKSGEDPLNLGLPRSQFPQLLPDQTTIDVNKLKTIEVEDDHLCRRELSKCPKNLCVISAQNCQRGGAFRIPVNSFWYKCTTWKATTIYKGYFQFCSKFRKTGKKTWNCMKLDISYPTHL